MTSIYINRTGKVANQFWFFVLTLFMIVSIEDSLGQSINNETIRKHGSWDEIERCIAIFDVKCARTILDNFYSPNLDDIEQFRYRKYLARVELLEGHYENAIEAFKYVVANDERSRSRQISTRYIAQLYATMGQFQQAYNSLVSLIAQEDELVTSTRLTNEAQAYADKGEFQQAYDVLEILMVNNSHIPLGKRHYTNEAIWQGIDIYATGNWDLVKLNTELPEFPITAITQGLQDGFVDVEFLITRTGETSNVRVIDSSNPVFEEAAILNAQKFRYKPKLEQGKPVEMTVQYRIGFKLSD